jgi:putative membrane protein
MIVRWILAATHLLALGIGLGAILDRWWSLRGPLDASGLRRVLRADVLWGVAAFLWISTGLLRAFAGFEKGTAYYLGNHVFLTKMGMLLLILILEVPAIATFTRWRAQLARGAAVDTTRAEVLIRISLIQTVLVVLMVFAATAMARGFGA